MEKVLVIKGDEITALYDDTLRELGGTLHVERASNVEWDDREQGWVATILPQHGASCYNDYDHTICYCDNDVLGPFMTREEALAAEVTFLQARL